MLVRPRKLAIYEGVPDLVEVRDFDSFIAKAGRDNASS